MARRPWAFGVLDTVVGAVGRLGIASSLEPDALATAARRRTGLDDLGAGDWREPLELLCRSATTEADLLPLGRYYLRQDLIQRLSNRLLIEDALRREPAILADPIPRPVFVLGLPRSGTTHLHRLLAKDPRNRALTTWEMSEPVPPPRPETYDEDPRIKRLERKLSFINWAGPDLRAIHEVDARQPEECISLMANDLCSVWFTIGVHLPSYVTWYHAQDLTRSYHGHRRQLQLLQRHLRLDRWVLKAPIHMHGLEWLLATYPDARIVWTHREPAAVVPSAASLLHNFRAVFGRPRDPREVGRDCLELLAGWVERGVRARAAYEARAASESGRPAPESGRLASEPGRLASEPGRLASEPGRLAPESGRLAPEPGRLAPDEHAVFVDVDYAEIVSSPLDVIARIYDAFEMPFGDEARRPMEAHLRNAVKNRFGVHRYALEDFGLDREQVETRFAGVKA